MNHRWFDRIFGVDLRSLALFRAILGALLALDAISKLIQFRDFYTDWGVMPRSYWIDNYMHAWKWSFHLAMGNELFPFLLILAQIAAAILFMVGFRARLSGAVTFVLMCSLQSRNYLVLSCADDLLRMALFWSLFLPVDAKFSARPNVQGTDRFSSVATMALLLQLAFVYLFTAYFKLDPVWSKEHSAIYYATNIDIFAKWFAFILREHLDLMRFMTAATLVWEFTGPILAFVPGRGRVPVILAFVGLHVGFFVTFELGFFPWVSIAYWLVFLPTEFWSARPGHWLETKLDDAFVFVRSKLKTAKSPRALAVTRANQGLAAFFLVFVFFYCMDTIRVLPWRLPNPVVNAAFALSINQTWDMFAPYPIRNDGWFVIEGTFKDGRTFDLLTGKPKTYEKPEVPSAAYPSSEWRKFMVFVWDGGNRKILLPYARYLCRRFSAENGEASDLSVFKIEFVKETTPPLGEPWPPTEIISLWSHDCFQP